MNMTKNPIFRRFYIAQAVSSFGDWVSYVVVPLIVYNITKDPVSVAIFTMCKFIPNIIVAPYLGKLRKRYKSIKLMAFSDFIRGIAFLGYLFTDNTVVIYFITFVISTFSAVFNPIKFSIIPKMVSNDEITDANACIAGVSKLMMLIGPSIGGILMPLLGQELIIIINSMSFFVSLYFILRISCPEDVGDINIKDNKIFNINEYVKNLSHIWNKRNSVVKFVLLSSIVNCTFGALNTLFPIVSSNFEMSSVMYGYIMSTLGLGLFLGTMVAPKLLNEKNCIQIYSYVTILGAIFLSIFGLSFNYVLTLIMVLGFSIGNGIQEISSVTYIQTIGEEDSLEIFTVSQTASSSLILITTGLSAVFAKFLGTTPTIIILSILTLISGILILFYNSRLLKEQERSI